MAKLNDVGHNYDRYTINHSAPTDGGVYGLYRSPAWIYFGEAINIRDRLVQHLDRDQIEQPCIALATPSGFCFVLVPGGKEARVAHQDAWIRVCQVEHRLCNQRLG
jgi:hypothetical protein